MSLNIAVSLGCQANNIYSSPGCRDAKTELFSMFQGYLWALLTWLNACCVTSLTWNQRGVIDCCIYKSAWEAVSLLPSTVGCEMKHSKYGKCKSTEGEDGGNAITTQGKDYLIEKRFH